MGSGGASNSFAVPIDTDIRSGISLHMWGRPSLVTIGVIMKVQDYLLLARNVPTDRAEFAFIILAEDMVELGIETSGASYDYAAQTWRDSHDHAHVARGEGATVSEARFMYCGADFETCQR